MRTSELVAAIAADAATPPKRLRPAFWAALGVSVLGAGLAFEALLGPRSDIGSAIATLRFPWKFVITIGSGLAAAALAMRLARPGADVAPARVALLAVVGLLAASVAFELFMIPSEVWGARLVGRNWLVCLVNVPIISAIPLTAILLAMRRGAPGSPTKLGAAAGLLAGAVGATFYAAHCPDDSPLFLAVWYPLSVGIVTALGAAVGSRLLKW